ncbi:MAG TPA: hypothetical protein DEH78_20090, partial [Solibacterales bacterium]|nr:hypothetical protein [Bryobacterales bacterium]
LPGRKTLLFFTEGLNVPPNMTDQFRNIISTANRANVSVYAVDAKGLLTAARNTSSGAMLQQATRAIQAQQTTGSRGGAVSPEQARAIDMAEESLRANVENNLQELAEETGGMLISNTNDLRLPLRQVSEDIGTYYELSYSP